VCCSRAPDRGGNGAPGCLAIEIAGGAELVGPRVGDDLGVFVMVVQKVTVANQLSLSGLSLLASCKPLC
jgi:hypothetical protein